MEVPGGHQNKAVVCLYEMIGTATLIMAVNWGISLTTANFQPIAVGLTLFANISILAPVCGGHFNPAVTIGVFIKEGRKNISQNAVFTLLIIISQIIGGILGVIIVFLA